MDLSSVRAGPTPFSVVTGERLLLRGGPVAEANLMSQFYHQRCWFLFCPVCVFPLPRGDFFSLENESRM